ncbi:amino acid permease [Runella limosa]|uniref:amino acid permease n=1 Tax=Runella limosa TaxID=370978 RepID=UPI000411F831|nr:amino acid permease [Runella limosa]
MSNSLFRKKSVSQVLNDIKTGEDGHGSMAKVLSVKDLTSFGIAAIIGGGIFSTIGNASYDGGAAVSLLFVFIAFACAFTGLCYAQFASTIPVSGSAYTYTYVSFGELLAWIIGWALILEYAVSNMVIAIGWSGYFMEMLERFGIHFPEYLATDFISARDGFNEFQEVIKAGGVPNPRLVSQEEAFRTAPMIGGFKVLMNIPAALVTVFITVLAYIGIKESRTTGNALVLFKVIVILAVIIIGAFYVNPENWEPFAPNGMNGVLLGVSAVFFSFIGFDSVSTTAEECQNPQRDLPRSIIYSLIICTILYVTIALVLNGMVSHKELKVDDPLAYVFKSVSQNAVGWQKSFLSSLSGIIAVSAVVAMTSALLAYQIGQPRIWMTMSRDGLLPKSFGKIHPKYKTPSFSTILTGVLVAIPSLFMNMKFVTDLTSVGTLFAFIIVCAGILYLDKHKTPSKFKVPYVNGKYTVGVLMIAALAWTYSQGGFVEHLTEKPLLIVLWLVWLGLAIASFLQSFSLLPVLGILTNLYLMTELGISNWIMFLIWLIIGLVIYFGYGYRKSNLIGK